MPDFFICPKKKMSGPEVLPALTFSDFAVFFGSFPKNKIEAKACLQGVVGTVEFLHNDAPGLNFRTVYVVVSIAQFHHHCPEGGYRKTYAAIESQYRVVFDGAGCQVFVSGFKVMEPCACPKYQAESHSRVLGNFAPDECSVISFAVFLVSVDKVEGGVSEVGACFAAQLEVVSPDSYPCACRQVGCSVFIQIRLVGGSVVAGENIEVQLLAIGEADEKNKSQSNERLFHERRYLAGVTKKGQA